MLEASADHVRDMAALEREHGIGVVFELIRTRARELQERDRFEVDAGD